MKRQKDDPDFTKLITTMTQQIITTVNQALADYNLRLTVTEAKVSHHTYQITSLAEMLQDVLEDERLIKPQKEGEKYGVG